MAHIQDTGAGWESRHTPSSVILAHSRHAIPMGKHGYQPDIDTLASEISVSIEVGRLEKQLEISHGTGHEDDESSSTELGQNIRDVEIQQQANAIVPHTGQTNEEEDGQLLDTKPDADGDTQTTAKDDEIQFFLNQASNDVKAKPRFFNKPLSDLRTDLDGLADTSYMKLILEENAGKGGGWRQFLSLIHISEPTRRS